MRPLRSVKENATALVRTRLEALYDESSLVGMLRYPHWAQKSYHKPKHKNVEIRIRSLS